MQCKFCGKENGIVLSMPLTGFCECSRRIASPAWSWEFEDEKMVVIAPKDKETACN